MQSSSQEMSAEISSRSGITSCILRRCSRGLENHVSSPSFKIDFDPKHIPVKVEADACCGSSSCTESSSSASDEEEILQSSTMDRATFAEDGIEILMEDSFQQEVSSVAHAFRHVQSKFSCGVECAPLEPLTKTVRFCEEANLYYPGLKDMTETECDRCWYAKGFTRSFKDDSFKACKEAFVKKPNRVFKWLSGDDMEFNEDANLILKSYGYCSNSKPKLVSKGFPFRDALLAMYQNRVDVIGLEHHLLTSARGEPKELIRYILHQRLLSMEGAQNCKEDEREALDMKMAQLSQSISDPICRLACETAMAQSLAL